MTALTAKQIYELSLAQIAAESFLDVALNSDFGLSLDAVLRLGSNNPGVEENRVKGA